jgi:ABC-2 type transport system ATP-binding protein
MRKLGKKQLTLELSNPLAELPSALTGQQLALAKNGHQLIYSFDTSSGEDTGIAQLLRKLGELHIEFKDLHTAESSLEEIFVSLVAEARDSRAV